MRAACGKTARAVRKGGRRQRHVTATSPDPTPANPPNNAGVPAAEAGEERGLGKRNVASNTRPGHRAGLGAPSALDRVRRVARQDKEARFTALLHHVDVDRLRAAYWAVEPEGRSRGWTG